MTSVFFLVSFFAAALAARLASAFLKAAPMDAAAVVMAAGGVASGLWEAETLDAAVLALGCATAVTVLAVGFFLEMTDRATASSVRLAAALCVWFGATAPLFAVLAFGAVLAGRFLQGAARRLVKRWKAVEANLGGTGWLQPVAARAGALRACAPVCLCGLAALMVDSVL